MDILGIGFAEFVFIMVIAMMVFGPRRLPEVAAKAGRIVADLRNMSRGLMVEWQREINIATELDEELKKTRQEFVGVKDDLTQAKKAVISDTTAVANAIAPPALAAQVSGPPATDPAPDTTTENTAPAADPPPASTETAPGAPAPDLPAEADAPPPKTAPAPVARPPVTATSNGTADAPAQNPEKDTETPVNEQ